ncbi:hypothetical protein GCM10010840_11270 [Deinococcus aerolatus]|uniref:Uncharacterized protein n=1 Tax=Deinococcus aerolatus TaxID=522487 RepID=A0ABQ2G4C4_9DEIO|nr:hypothetical protein GCM10010840_11270 [Deinococcus aerolatus]
MFLNYITFPDPERSKREAIPFIKAATLGRIVGSLWPLEAHPSRSTIGVWPERWEPVNHGWDDMQLQGFQDLI